MCKETNTTSFEEKDTKTPQSAQTEHSKQCSCKKIHPAIISVLLLITAPFTIPLTAGIGIASIMSALVTIMFLLIPAFALLIVGGIALKSMIMAIPAFATGSVSGFMLLGVTVVCVAILFLGIKRLPNFYKQLYVKIKDLMKSIKWNGPKTILKIIGSLLLFGVTSMITIRSVFLGIITIALFGFSTFMFTQDVAIAVMVLGGAVMVLAIAVIVYYFLPQLIKWEYTFVKKVVSK